MTSPVARYVALLRAVNLGGKTEVDLEAVRGMFRSLGLEEVVSVLRSGNVVFNAPAQPSERLEGRLESEARRRLALDTAFLVRSAAQWSQTLARNPFPEMAEKDPGHLLVAFLKDAPDAEHWKALREAIRGPEKVEGREREAYLVYPEGVGRSRLTAQFIERHLGTRGTSRNWNTVRKLASLLNG
ncbi:MAG: DUF1697 domain-containing protein [Thermoplasmata archaeon]|nr:DUF1697 domain-containing protein [Thermoplasmata archaeon]